MKTYIGTKIIKATPMTRLAYNQLRGWALPANESGDDAGFLVEYTDGGKPNLEGYGGYVSWSPAEQFDGAYRETSGLTFGLALEALKKGGKVARAGWNGKGMWLSLSGDGGREVDADKFWSPNNAQFAKDNGGKATVLPCITMKTVNAHGREAILMGWLASQTDMLSDDWAIV
jgi:Protein of unknown function (DUF2829)